MYTKHVWKSDKYFNFNYVKYLPKDYIPYSLKTFGVVNYYGDEIKLDVSGNSVIAGSNHLKKELANIVLKYMKQKTTDLNWLTMLEQLIQYNYKNKSGTENNMFIA